MAVGAPIIHDLPAASEALDPLLAPIPAPQWMLATPPPVRTIAHQIGHLLRSARVSTLSTTD